MITLRRSERKGLPSGVNNTLYLIFKAVRSRAAFFCFKMEPQIRTELIEYLREFTTEARWDKIMEVLSLRTNHITVVLEDLHKPHNANAVLRSCDGFGIQDVHIIENENEFDTSATVSIGAHQWLSLHRYREKDRDNVKYCFDNLKAEGYRVLATTPHENDSNLEDVEITQKTALVFGTERHGVSDKVMEQADGFVKIPMSGFSESFNISVSAAICLYDLTTRLRNSEEVHWHLDPDVMEELKLKWLLNTIKAGKKLQAKFMEEKGYSH